MLCHMDTAQYQQQGISETKGMTAYEMQYADLITR